MIDEAIEKPTREEVKKYMEERKAGGADSKPFIGKWTGSYGRDIGKAEGKMITVHFEDHGQDFLEWDIQDGVAWRAENPKLPGRKGD